MEDDSVSLAIDLISLAGTILAAVGAANLLHWMLNRRE
jgi:hypothetical protein